VPFHRRSALGALAAGALVPAGRTARAMMGPPAPEGWALAPTMVKRIVAPRFPARDFEVTRFGAKGDGKSDARPAIAAAIAACSAAGGGRVLVPAGTYAHNGPLYLKSNVNLQLDAGATLKFSTMASDYLPNVLVRWEGTRCYNYSPLIYAHREKNIAITGAGIIDGQAEAQGSSWMSMFRNPRGKTRDELRSMGRRLVPLEKRVFGAASSLRPQLFHTYECKNILLEGVTFAGTPFWAIHPAFSSNITVRRITVRREPPAVIINDDGLVIDSCRDVLVEGSTFDIDCDNVAIKSGRDNDAWNGMACENVLIRNSTFKRGCGAIVVGSEVSGGVRNIFAEDNVALGTRYGFYIKSNAQRGGVVEKLFFRNFHIKQVEDCIRLESGFMDVRTELHPTHFRTFQFENISCERATERGIRSEGMASTPIEDLTFRNIRISGARAPLEVANTRAYSFENVSINGVVVGQQSRL
jgi:polygalacturonase